MLGDLLAVVEKTATGLGRGVVIGALAPVLSAAGWVLFAVQRRAGLLSLFDTWANRRSLDDILLAAATLVALILVSLGAYVARSRFVGFLQGDWPFPRVTGALGLSLARRKRSRAEEQRNRVSREKIDPIVWARRGCDIRRGSVAEPDEDLHAALQGIEQDLARLRAALRDSALPPDERRVVGLLRDSYRVLPTEQAGALTDRTAGLRAAVCEYVSQSAVSTLLDSLYYRALREKDAWELDLREVPSEPWTRPTRFGNVFAAASQYVYDRYGIDLESLWPRLSLVIPKEQQARLEDANLFLTFAVLSAVAWAVAAPVIWVLDPIVRDRSFLDHLWPGAVALAIAYAAYQLAVLAAGTYVAAAKAAVDLFRRHLLDALGVRQPYSLENERDVWLHLKAFFDTASLPDPTVVRYDQTFPKSASGPAGPQGSPGA